MLRPPHNARMNAPQPPAAQPGVTLVIGAGGGIGAALLKRLQDRGETVIALGRRTEPALDYRDEASLVACAGYVASQLESQGQSLRRLVVATGFLHGPTGAGVDAGPERSWQHLDPAALTHNFLVNAIGPALVIKHFLPLLPKQGRCIAAFLSARVGSVGDNRLGGWYAYRASKAALNQLVHTAAIELARRNREAICVVLHPGTVHTPLSQPFAKTGLKVRPPEVAAQELLSVVDGLAADQTGGFFDHLGQPVPW
jgi:NAD(P)-dependent dehydrogenase (short-subunit alcohol dehydrogenase family)